MKTGASQQGRAGHQWSCASAASLLGCFWEVLLELQPDASPGTGPGWAQGAQICITFVCWPWTITFFANNSQNLGRTRLLFDCMTSRGFLLFAAAYYGEQAAHVDRWRGMTGVSYLLLSQYCIMVLGFLFLAAFTN